MTRMHSDVFVDYRTLLLCMYNLYTWRVISVIYILLITTVLQTTLKSLTAQKSVLQKADANLHPVNLNILQNNVHGRTING